jgi:hypothetical protein
MNRWWIIVGLLGATALVQAACSGETETETSSGGNGGEGMTTTTPQGGMGTGGVNTGGSPIVCNSPADMPYTTVPDGGECDLLQNDCASGSGCEVVSDGNDSFTTACIPGAGLKEAGADCSSKNECKPGMNCIFNQFCSPVCCRDGGNAPCGAGTCDISQTDGAFETYFCSYLTLCDLFEPTQCDSGADGKCYPYLGAGYSVCAPGGGAADGDPCININDCETDSICVPGTKICHHACYIMGGAGLNPGEGGCPMGETCNFVNSGLDNIGACG